MMMHHDEKREVSRKKKKIYTSTGGEILPSKKSLRCSTLWDRSRGPKKMIFKFSMLKKRSPLTLIATGGPIRILISILRVLAYLRTMSGEGARLKKGQFNIGTDVGMGPTDVGTDI